MQPSVINLLLERTVRGGGLEALLGPEIILVRGLLKLVPAAAYHFCLNLLATFSQPRTSIISGPSRPAWLRSRKTAFSRCEEICLSNTELYVTTRSNNFGEEE